MFTKCVTIKNFVPSGEEVNSFFGGDYIEKARAGEIKTGHFAFAGHIAFAHLG